MAAQCEQFLAAGGVPKFGGFIVARCGDFPAIGTEGDTRERSLVAAQGQQFAAGCDVPHAGGFIETRGGQTLAVGTEGRTPNLVLVTFQREYLVARSGVPELGGFVVADGGQAPAIGTERQSENGSLVVQSEQFVIRKNRSVQGGFGLRDYSLAEVKRGRDGVHGQNYAAFGIQREILDGIGSQLTGGCDSFGARCPDGLPTAYRNSGDQQNHERGRNGHAGPMFPREFAGAVGAGRRRRFYRLTAQISSQIGGQVGRGAIAALAILLERLERDPIQIGGEMFLQFAGPLGIFFANFSQQFVKWKFLVERRCAYQQFVKNDAEGINVGARIDIGAAIVGLFRAHVAWCSNDDAYTSSQRELFRARFHGFRQTEINDFGHRPAVLFGDQNIGWFQIAVQNGFLVRMLDAVADQHEQFDTLASADLVRGAVIVDRHAFHIFHREIGTAFGG